VDLTVENTAPSPIFLKKARIDPCRMGRFETTTETNSSRTAHSLPETAPSGPDWGRHACQSFHSSLWQTRQERAYRKDNDSTDDGSHHDEDDSTEQEAQGGLLLHAEVDGPEQLPES
jgi:hypothetical protein